jgi:Tfp pilus assembly PilM family ATPase
MPRILAIDWDRLEARAILVQAGPTGTSVADAWVVPLKGDGGAAPTAKQIGSQLATSMRGQPGGRVTTLVGVGRDQVQMILLSLPPAPAEELPDLVRFQAEREFTSLGADAALDYIPLTGDATTPYQVLAAAMSSSDVGEVNDVCQALGVEPDRITMRATAAASFVARRAAPGANEVALIANRLTDEADLTVLVGDHVVLIRTVRLPDHSEEGARQRVLVGEIRRTIAAVRQQLGESQVKRVILCGNASEAGEAAALSAELTLPVEVFDVADNAPSGLARIGITKEALPRFAAVLGMALGEADRRPPVVDFLHVRRRAQQQRFSRLHGLAVAAAAVVVLAVGVKLWRDAVAPFIQLQQLNNEIADLDKQNKQYQKVITRAAAIDRWRSTDVNWLDEFDRFGREWRPQPLDSKEFATSDDAVISQVTAFRPPGIGAKGGILDVQATAKSAAAVAGFEKRLRDDAHRLTTGGGKQDHTIPGYDWSFGLRMNVTPDVDKDAE